MQQSSVPAPVPSPVQPERKLTPVPEPKKRRGQTWLWMLLVVVFCAGAYWLYQRNLAEAAISAKRAMSSAIRTAAVGGGGKMISSIRLMGTTGPEKYVTIMGPQMRGSRNFAGGQGAFMGRSRGGGGGSGGGNTQTASTGGGSSSSGSSSSSTSSSSSSSMVSSSNASGSSSGLSSGAGSDSSGGGSSIGGVRTSAGALKATTSRTSSTSSSTRSSSAKASTASASLGGDGLGSTSSALQGGGTGGGGGGGGGGVSDFGSVLQDLIKSGSQVKKGDRVAEFDRQFMTQRLDDYKAGVLQQELSMRRLLSDMEVTQKSRHQQVLIAKGDVDKANLDLKTVPVRSQIDIERLQLALEEAVAKYKQVLAEEPFAKAGDESQVKISEMDLQQSKIELRRAEQNAERMVIKSPLAGLVVMMQIFRGSEFGTVQEGDPVPPGFPFMQIVDPSSMVVNAVINQADVERMRVGAKAKIRFDAFPDLELSGHVYSIAAMPRSSGSSARASYLKEIPVRIKLDQMDPRVIPDLSVSVDVTIEEEDAKALISLASVFYDSPDAKPYVFVRMTNSWEKRTVELGLSNNTHVSVKSGLTPGEVVAEEIPPSQPQSQKT